MNAVLYRANMARQLLNSTHENRITHVAARAQGFIYLVSLTGVTGARAQVQAMCREFPIYGHGSGPQPA